MQNLLVYGTLRVGGEANHLLEDSRLILQDVKIYNFELYSLGSYPAAVPSRDYNSFIIADLYEIDFPTLEIIDEYEGHEFVHAYLPPYDAIIYIASEEKLMFVEKIKSGDWIEYINSKGKN